MPILSRVPYRTRLPPLEEVSTDESFDLEGEVVGLHAAVVITSALAFKPPPERLPCGRHITHVRLCQTRPVARFRREQLEDVEINKALRFSC